MTILKHAPSHQEFLDFLEESFRYCREVDDSGSIDFEMARWQEWIKTWPQILNENGGI